MAGSSRKRSLPAELVHLAAKAIAKIFQGGHKAGKILKGKASEWAKKAEEAEEEEAEVEKQAEAEEKDLGSKLNETWNKMQSMAATGENLHETYKIIKGEESELHDVVGKIEKAERDEWQALKGVDHLLSDAKSIESQDAEELKQLSRELRDFTGYVQKQINRTDPYEREELEKTAEEVNNLMKELNSLSKDLEKCAEELKIAHQELKRMEPEHKELEGLLSEAEHLSGEIEQIESEAEEMSVEIGNQQAAEGIEDLESKTSTDEAKERSEEKKAKEMRSRIQEEEEKLGKERKELKSEIEQTQKDVGALVDSVNSIRRRANFPRGMGELEGRANDIYDRLDSAIEHLS
jgi:flagellar hook-basal body complex protein FliE